MLWQIHKVYVLNFILADYPKKHANRQILVKDFLVTDNINISTTDYKILERGVVL